MTNERNANRAPKKSKYVNCLNSVGAFIGKSVIRICQLYSSVSCSGAVYWLSISLEKGVSSESEFQHRLCSSEWEDELVFSWIVIIFPRNEIHRSVKCIRFRFGNTMIMLWAFIITLLTDWSIWQSLITPNLNEGVQNGNHTWGVVSSTEHHDKPKTVVRHSLHLVEISPAKG